jgi:hypothetical protein
VNVEVGCGFIVIEYVIGNPTQVPIVGVTVMVPDIAAEVKFVPVNDGTCPAPLTARPIAALLFVHA